MKGALATITALTLIGATLPADGAEGTEARSSENELLAKTTLNRGLNQQYRTNTLVAAESIRAPEQKPSEAEVEKREEKQETLIKEGDPTFETMFGIPAQGPDFKPSKAIRCDAIRHLKTPTTYRRLDSYFRPEALLPQAKDSDFWKRDFLTGDWGKFRSKLNDLGVDLYGCWGFDQLNVVQSNVSPDQAVKTPAPNFNDQQNYVQLYGLDFYSELASKEWKGGQLHFSFAWPETRPVWLFGNDLISGSQSVHGNFYYDTGAGRTNGGSGNSAASYQGFRVFEIWLQQRYGKKQENFIRAGNIYPWINFNRTMLAAMFNYWTFDEPGSFGSIPSAGRGPIYPTAPLGVQWYQLINDNMEFLAQVGAGYYDPSGGIENRRGLTWFLDNNNGLEGITQLTFKGGTYSSNSKDFGLPWLVHIGWQFHTGRVYSNYLDINGNPAQLTNLPYKEYNFNTGFYVTLESMLWRERGSYNQGLTAFVKTTQYFEDYINQIRNTYVMGVGYEGLLPSRNNDVLMAGFGIVNMTQGAKQWESLTPSCTKKAGGGCISSGVQYIFELGYSAKLTPWMFVQPSIQYLAQPAGRMDLGNITTFTISVGLAF
jgi:carbohydrate-selective porin OprB